MECFRNEAGCDSKNLTASADLSSAGVSWKSRAQGPDVSGIRRQRCEPGRARCATPPRAREHRATAFEETYGFVVFVLIDQCASVFDDDVRGPFPLVDGSFLFRELKQICQVRIVLELRGGASRC